MKLGVFSFFVLIAYWPFIDGASTSPRWALLAAGVWLFARPTVFTLAHAVVAAFVVWSALSGLWTPYRWDWVWSVMEALVFAGAFWAGSACKDLRPVFIGIALGVGVSSVIAVGQYLGHNPDWLHWQGRPAGLFINKNILAEIGVMALVATVAARLWWFVPATVPAAVMPGSRASVIAMALGLALLPGIPRWVAWFGAAAVVFATLLLFTNGAALNSSSLETRLDFYRVTTDGLTAGGHGAGSFFGKFSAYVTHDMTERPIHAHNDLLHAAFETGLAGVALFVLLAVLVARGNRSPAALVLLAFLVEGIFGFPLHMPATAFFAALVAGHLCRGWPDLLRPAPVWRAAA